MDLLHNPIADMYGPDFLLLYSIVIVITFIGYWLIRLSIDSTASLPPLAIPSRPDPYEIAYLRGGEAEVAYTAIFSLLQQRYLQATTDTPQRIERSTFAPAPGSLSPLEQTIYDWFDTPHTANEIFTPSHSLTARLQPYCHVYEQKHHSEGLLTSPAMKRTIGQVWLAGMCIIAGLGIYKLIVALIKGHSNVWFLILMGIVSLLILLMMRGVSRLTRRGKAYLEQLQMAFAPLRQQIAQSNGGPIDTAGTLAVGLFGMALLAGTPYGFYEEMHRQTVAASSFSDSGGGDGGSSDGGGGDGGDGGGDGGCGGGCGGCGGA